MANAGVLSRGLLSAGLLLIGAGALAGCASKAAPSSFTLAVLAEDNTPVNLLNRAIEQAIVMCSVPNAPKVITWKFAKADVDKPLAAQYQNGKFPTSQDCAVIKSSSDNGFLTPSTSSAETTAKK